MSTPSLVEVVDERAYGGKARQLGAALRAGLPVPAGIALSHELVAAIAVDVSRARGLEGTVAALGGVVAVRSSAIGEDSAVASFAGQHATVLGVTSHRALVDAILVVHGSAHTPSALAYRARLGLDGSPRMGIVVQRLVDAEIAGVLFTVNPMTGVDERVIEASWGLGEAVVAGMVTPDRFRIARDGRIVERTAGHKDLAIRLAAHGGTQQLEVDDARAAQLCLDDAQLAALHALASRCESHASAPLDLEWAFAGGELVLLQQRAITRAGS